MVTSSYPQDPRVDTSGATKYSWYLILYQRKELKGQYFDELTLGYEREVFTGTKAGARLSTGTSARPSIGGTSMARVLRYGNPGFRSNEEYPKARREYASIELTVERVDPSGLSFMAAYTLSRTYGNYRVSPARHTTRTRGVSQSGPIRLRSFSTRT